MRAIGVAAAGVLIAGALVTVPGASAMGVQADAAKPAGTVSPGAGVSSERSAQRAGAGQLWLPVRNSAVPTCAQSNCKNHAGKRYHGYWALDFRGAYGDPINAALPGVAHIGGRGAACGTVGKRGNWVWISHAGRTTQYLHLATITVTEGQSVTPATQIGTMGGGGSGPPCATNHLHFELRRGGDMWGPRINPGQLRACVAGTLVDYPRVLGFESWNGLPGLQFLGKWHPGFVQPKQYPVTSEGNAC